MNKTVQQHFDASIESKHDFSRKYLHPSVHLILRLIPIHHNSVDLCFSLLWNNYNWNPKLKLDAFACVKSYFIFLFVKSNTEPSSIFLCNQYFYRSLHVYFLFNVKPLKFYFCLIYTLETQKPYKNWRRGVYFLENIPPNTYSKSIFL